MMTSSQRLTVLRPRIYSRVSEPGLTARAKVTAIAIFALLVLAAILTNLDIDLRKEWLSLVPYILATAVTFALSVRLDGGLYTGFTPVSAFTFALMIGFERAALVLAISSVLVAPLMLLYLSRAGLPRFERSPLLIETTYSQGTTGLSLLAAGWLEHVLASGPSIRFEFVFLGITSLYFALTVLRSAAWLWLRHMSFVNFARHFWHLVLVNHFVAVGLAPILASALKANPLGVDGLLLYTFGLLLLTVLDNGYLEISRRLTHLATLNNVARALASCVEFDDVLHTLRDELGKLIDVAGFYFALFDERTGIINFPVDYQGNALQPYGQAHIGQSTLTEHVILARKPVLINHDVPGYLERMKIKPFSQVGRSYLGVPVISGSSVVGVIALRSFQQEHAYSPDDVTLMQGIASQAGIALHNVELYRQSRRQASELSSLNRVTSLISASTDLSRLLSTVCQMVVGEMGYDKAAIWLTEPDGKSARLVNSTGLSKKFRTMSAVLRLDSPRAEVLSTGKPVVIHDILLVDAVKDGPDLVQEAGFRSVVEVPLTVSGSVIGSVAAYYIQPKHIGPNEVELLGTLGGLIAVAVESARLFEAISARSNELATLYEASESLNASLSLKNVLRALSVTMIQSLRVASCSTWLTDESGMALRAALRMTEIDGGGNEELFTPIEIRLEDLPRIKRAVKHRKTLVLSREASDLSEQALRLMDHCEIANGLALPLVMHGHMAGLLIVAPPRDQTGFEPEQMRIAEALANQAALAIDNAQRFERTDIALSSRLDELSALERVSRRMTGQLDMQSVIEEVAEAAVLATGVEYIDVALLDEESGMVRTILRRASLPEEGVPMAWRADAGLTGRALRSQKTLSVGDVSGDPSYVDARKDVRAELVAPIILEDQIIGVLNLESTRLNAFTPEHERFVTNLAEYAAIAIANARLYESERRQREIAEILLETSAAVTSSPSLSEVLLTLSHQLLNISGFHGCAILELDPEDNQLTLVTEHTACVWPNGGGQIYPLADFPATARVLKSGKPATLYLGMPNPDPAELVLQERHGLATVLMLPVRAGKTIIGLVEVTSATTDLAGDDKALSRYEQLLADAAKHFVAPLEANPTELLVELAQQLAAQTPYTNCWLSTYDRDRKCVVTTLQYGDLFWSPGRGPSIKLDDDPIMAKVIKTGASFVSRVRGEEYTNLNKLSGKWGKHTLISQPLARKGQTIGVVQLFNVSEDRYITEDELRLWRLVGDQAAVAIENANLFETIQRRGEEFSTLRSVAVELMASTSLKDGLQTICQHAIERTGASEVFIYLYEQEQDQLSFGTSLRRTGEIDRETMPSHPNSIMATVARSEESLVITDLQKHPTFADVAQMPHWQAINSIVAMPLRSGGQTIGVFVIAFADRAHPSEDVLHFLDLLAAQAAVAIENTRLVEETRTGRDRLEAVLNSSHDGLMMFDPEQRLVLSNPRTEYLLNFRLTDKVQRHFLDIMQRISDTLDEHERTGWMRNALELAGSIRSDPLATTRRHYTLGVSTPHAIEETSVAVTDTDGELLGRLFVLHDVTDQVELEAYRDELSSMIVHDLRSPLGSLITGLDMALSEVNSMPESSHTEPLQVTLGVGLSSANALLKLVDAILDINKLETGDMPLILAPMDLRKIARAAQERLEPAAAAAQISVKISAPRRLPEIVADQEKIERVIVNLLDNALRYSPRGGKVQIDIQSKPTHQTLTVLDSGEGIAPEYRDRVFERFFQLNAHGRKRGNKGTGLGLTFCQLAVEAHQGRIWVDDGPEGGAAFHFTLPTDLTPTPDPAE